ncbi:unnamed protein product [marine sediment metagenome]|uniref:Uncharacterized protein n=1 Tax=marine sediment metagenome TaxID=412755 RepID=X0TEL6_9ZZZZ
MTSLEEQLKQQTKKLELAESQKERYLKGVPDYEAYREVLEEDATKLLRLIRRLREADFPGNIDLLEEIQLAIKASNRAVEAIDGVKPELQHLLEDIRDTIVALDKKFQEEMERQAEIRKLEKETLENINEYLAKQGG